MSLKAQAFNFYGWVGPKFTSIYRVGGPRAHKLGATICPIDYCGRLWYIVGMVNIKYLTKDLLQSLNAKALRGKLNRTLKGLEDLDPDNKYPVTDTFVCDDRIIRCWVALMANQAGKDLAVQLDMTIEDYQGLPSVNI